MNILTVKCENDFVSRIDLFGSRKYRIASHSCSFGTTDEQIQKNAGAAKSAEKIQLKYSLRSQCLLRDMYLKS